MHHAAFSARRIADADPAEKVSATFLLRRRPGHPKLPDQLYWSRTPAGKRTFLSREEFAKQYGADPGDLIALRKFARASGLKVVQSSLARRTLIVSGTVKQMNRIFGVDMGIYAMPDGVYRGLEGKIFIPKAIADLVVGVFGLDNRRMLRKHGAPAGPAGAVPLNPREVAKLYNFNSAASNGLHQTIGLIEFGGGYVRLKGKDIEGLKLPDIDAFFASVDLATPKITDVYVDGATNDPDSTPLNIGDSLEVALDIDVAGSIAPEADLVVYFAPDGAQGWIDAISTAVHDAVNKPSILSISWGRSEYDGNGNPSWTQSTLDSTSELFAEAAAMGISVFAASGDDGSNCLVSTGEAYVIYPASDPWVTSCGGTIITDVDKHFSFDEHTWNDISWSGSIWSGYIGGATGGGFSRVFPHPGWQPATRKRPLRGFPFGRGVPDIAGNASRYSGYTIQVFGVKQLVGGTSAVAPLYAGFFARLNATLGRNLGYLNPTLYEFSSAPSVFRDIKDNVSNAAPFGLPGGLSSVGYKSVAGWDPCTGLGVIDGALLVNRLKPN